MADPRAYPHISFRKCWNLTPEVSFELGQCEAVVRAISSMPLLPTTHTLLLRVSLQKGARATTAIEGNTLTEEEVERIEAGESLPPSKEYMEREVKNILDAYNSLLEEVALNDKTELVCADLLLRFHRMIGQDLGEHFEAIPGRFAERPRFVLTYRAPDHSEIPELVERLCTWLAQEFHFADGKQTFAEAVVQAIVTHVYIEWIHPFSDGNGRTGRLVESYLLLRAGNPDIASHILSNFYNETRAEYYRQLDRAGRTGDLSAFIAYAVQGLRDGLVAVLEKMQRDQLEITWRKYIYDRFGEIRLRQRKRNVFVRQRRLALDMPVRELTIPEMVTATPVLTQMYAGLSAKTIRRDLQVLSDLGLIRKKGDTYALNIDLLALNTPTRSSSGSMVASGTPTVGSGRPSGRTCRSRMSLPQGVGRM